MRAKTISEFNKEQFERKFTDDFKKHQAHRYDLLFDALADEIGKKATRLRYVDVGPRGNFLERARGLGYDAEGMDISDELIKFFKKKGINVIKADLQQKIPLKANTYDAVSALEVIEHVVDTEFFVREMRRILKKGGLLILSTPNITSLGSRIRMLFGYLPLQYSCRYGMRWGHHVRLFNKGALKKILEVNGFEVEKLIGTELYLNPNSCNKGLHSRFLGRIFPCLAQKLFIVGRKR